MNEHLSKKIFLSRPWKRLLSRLLLGSLLLAFILYVLFRLLLVSPYASEYLSTALSRYTKQKITVAELSTTGKSIYLNDIVIEAPPGFTSRKMITVRTIALTPDYTALLLGKRSLSRLDIVGLDVIAEKNVNDSWNFSELVRRFTKKKAKPSGEIFIKHFSLHDASLQLNGHRIGKFGITLADFSTKGTTNSALELSGKDDAGNPLRLTAQGHLGNNPSLNVTVKAPTLSLAPLQKLLPNKPLHLDKARGEVSISAELRNRLLTIQTSADFKELSFSYPGGSLPVNGHIDVKTRYDSLSDNAEITRADLTINKVIAIRSTGSVQQVSKERAFALRLSPWELDLGALASLLPESKRRGIALSGEMSSRGFLLRGSRSKGIVDASGELTLRKVSLKRAKQFIIAGGAADLSLQKVESDWQVDGRILSGSHQERPLADSILLPFSARLSPRFKPTRIDTSAFKASLAGIPVKGAFHYRATSKAPFTLNCSAVKVPLTALNRYLKKEPESARLTSGTLTVSANLSGISPQMFRGKLALELDSAEARTGSKMISLAKTALACSVQKNSGIFSANGALKASGGVFDSKPFGIAAKFFIINRKAELHTVDLTYGPSRIKADRVMAQFPEKDHIIVNGTNSLLASLTGTEFVSGNLSASGIAGHLEAQYRTGKQEMALSGSSDFSFASLAFKNKTLAKGTMHLSADGRKARATITGSSLGGTLSAQAAMEIFSKKREISFAARLLKQQLGQLEGLLPRKVTPRIASGTADVHLTGRYSRESGITGSLATNGGDISLKSPAGKTLISGISAVIDTTFDRQTLTVKKGLLSHPQGPSLRITGAIEQPASASRKGELSFSMPAIALNSLLDVFANALPRNLQEASCEGTGALAGTILLENSGSRTNGDLILESASLEIPSQKISVAGIAGTIPFSMESSRKQAKPEQLHLSYSRKNYSTLLNELSGISGAGKSISINSLRFGAFETGNISLFISTSSGTMKFSPIKVQLYDGRLLGSGYLVLNGTPRYGADILLNDLSLKDFCNSFPSIKGYITGRVDGILSLKNQSGGLKEMTGYVNLWTRSGKGEEMLVSKEFLQKLAGKKLRGFFFQNDRSYDNGEISAYLQHNYLTFEKLDISHTNFLGMKDLNVSVAPVQNRIALDHLLESIRDAAARGKGGGQGTAPVQTDLKWLE